MKILVACEKSQAVTKEFRRLGHESYSKDSSMAYKIETPLYSLNMAIEESCRAIDCIINRKPYTNYTREALDCTESAIGLLHAAIEDLKDIEYLRDEPVEKICYDCARLETDCPLSSSPYGLSYGYACIHKRAK